MPMIKAASFPGDIDLSVLSRLLWQAGLPHRISEQAGEQVLWVADENAVEIARSALIAFERGELSADMLVESPSAASGASLSSTLISQPLTIGLIALSILIGLIIGFGAYANPLSWFTFVDFQLVAGAPYFDAWSDTLAQGEIWRLLSPVFIHFSLLHLVFNMMWLYLFGGRIESHMSARMLLSLVIIIGVVSNATQYLFSMESPLFGGFSGVVYGLLGFCWAYDRFVPGSGLAMPPAIVGLMVGWLLICFTGVLEVIGFGSIANAAHTAGLLSGALLGALVGLIFPSAAAKG